MKIIRWAIIGAGGIADRRAIPALIQDPRNEIVAVMDQAGAVAEKIARKYGIAQFFSNADVMLDTVDCDAVYIATPVGTHYALATAALAHGVHVFMEKPISLNYKEGAAILEAAEKAGKQLTIGYMMGYHNLHQTARRLVQAGKLGQLHSVRMQFTCWYPDIPGAWRQKKALGGGGCIMDLAVHCMELFHQITGDEIAECKSYYATNTFQYEVEDTAVILFKSKGGIIGHIDVNFNIPDNCAASKLELYGSEGSLYAEGTLAQEEVGKMKYIYAPQGAYDAQQARLVTKAKTYYGKKGNIYTKQFQAFRALVTGGKPDYANARQALQIQQLCDGIYEDHE